MSVDCRGLGYQQFPWVSARSGGNDSGEALLTARHSSVEDAHFEEALREQVAVWLAEGETHILLCGMIGSRQGWVEAEYLPCPAGIEDSAAAAIQVPFAGAEVWLIPGVIGSDAGSDAGPDTAGVPEVMRGEETAAIGMLDACGGAGLACFPGTHSKWIHLRDQKIVSFATWMTGEIYSALRQCTILGRMMTADTTTDESAFHEGVERSADSGGVLHHLFGVRTLALTGQMKETASSSYLSGLLIGHEVRAAMPRGGRVHLAGARDLCSLYAHAIDACSGSAAVEDADAAARGLAAIGRRLRWT